MEKIEKQYYNFLTPNVYYVTYNGEYKSLWDTIYKIIPHIKLVNERGQCSLLPIYDIIKPTDVLYCGTNTNNNCKKCMFNRDNVFKIRKDVLIHISIKNKILTKRKTFSFNEDATTF